MVVVASTRARCLGRALGRARHRFYLVDSGSYRAARTSVTAVAATPIPVSTILRRLANSY